MGHFEVGETLAMSDLVAVVLRAVREDQIAVVRSEGYLKRARRKKGLEALVAIVPLSMSRLAAMGISLAEEPGGQGGATWRRRGDAARPTLDVIAAGA